MGTLHNYAPSDGVDVTLDNVAVRNLLLVADKSGENFNVVFTAVNTSNTPALLNLTFTSESGSSNASADFRIAPGTTLFGDPNGAVEPTLVSVAGLKAGATVTAYIETAAGGSVERQVPVLDGTLPEYKDFVL